MKCAHTTNSLISDDKFSLDKIIEKEALKSDIKFDDGSFKIIDSAEGFILALCKNGYNPI